MKAVCFLPCFSTLYSVLYIQCSIVISFQRLIADGPLNWFSLLVSPDVSTNFPSMRSGGVVCRVLSHDFTFHSPKLRIPSQSRVVSLFAASPITIFCSRISPFPVQRVYDDGRTLLLQSPF